MTCCIDAPFDIVEILAKGSEVVVCSRGVTVDASRRSGRISVSRGVSMKEQVEHVNCRSSQ